MAARKLSPVIQWAGGKTQLLDAITARMPETFGKYYEPFIGGGALWLAAAPKRAAINDANEQLANLYRQLKENAGGVISHVRELDGAPCGKERYYGARERYNGKIASGALDSECAALLLWLNRHCYGGLYRVKQKGLFNVPYNSTGKEGSVDEKRLLAVAEYLQSSDISVTCLDFEEACKEVCAGDFVYFDSPYLPLSDTANFTAYTKERFSLGDHRRLAALFRRLDRAGALVMLSNNDVPMARELYRGFNIQSYRVKRPINNAVSREVLVTNY